MVVLLLALCRKAVHSSAVFRQLVGLVMSYSFTDAEEEDELQRTVMVPFVDLLNHHSQHHAELTFGQKSLRLVAVRGISKVVGGGMWQRGGGGWLESCSDMMPGCQGEEVMNTYGALSNTSLVHTYGFSEPDNPHEKVSWPPDAPCARLRVKLPLTSALDLECRVTSGVSK